MDLYLLECDWESKKHGYSAASYIQVLNDNLIEIYQSGLIFMQDNVPIHSAKKNEKKEGLVCRMRG